MVFVSFLERDGERLLCLVTGVGVLLLRLTLTKGEVILSFTIFILLLTVLDGDKEADLDGDNPTIFAAEKRTFFSFDFNDVFDDDSID